MTVHQVLVNMVAVSMRSISTAAAVTRDTVAPIVKLKSTSAMFIIRVTMAPPVSIVSPVTSANVQRCTMASDTEARTAR